MAVLAALAACGGGGGAHGLRVDDLAKAGSTCPVPLAADSTSDHPTPTATAEPDPGAAAYGNGVAVSCGVTLGGGRRLDLTLDAARDGNVAPHFLLPLVGVFGKLGAAQLHAVAATADRTKPGQLVPLPGSEAVAMAIVRVRGAKSAAFVLSGTGVPRSSVETIARRLAGGLA